LIIRLAYNYLSHPRPSMDWASIFVVSQWLDTLCVKVREISSVIVWFDC